jgi:hypothetical protein
MSVNIPQSWAQIEQAHPVGDSYTISIIQEGFSFTAYTCTAILTDAKGNMLEMLAVAKSGTGDNTLTITATSEQMAKQSGVYYWRLKIAQESEVTTIAICKLTLKALPIWQ